MKTSVTVFLGLLLLFGAAIFAHAQDSEWDMVNEEAISLYQKGQYEHAVVVAEKALDVAENALGPNHPDVATSYSRSKRKGTFICRSGNEMSELVDTPNHKPIRF